MLGFLRQFFGSGTTIPPTLSRNSSFIPWNSRQHYRKHFLDRKWPPPSPPDWKFSENSSVLVSVGVPKFAVIVIVQSKCLAVITVCQSKDPKTNNSVMCSIRKEDVLNNGSGILFSWRDNSSYRLYTLGPLCLWQCLIFLLQEQW